MAHADSASVSKPRCSVDASQTTGASQSLPVPPSANPRLHSCCVARLCDARCERDGRAVVGCAFGAAREHAQVHALNSVCMRRARAVVPAGLTRLGRMHRHTGLQRGSRVVAALDAGTQYEPRRFAGASSPAPTCTPNRACARRESHTEPPPPAIRISRDPARAARLPTRFRGPNSRAETGSDWPSRLRADGESRAGSRLGYDGSRVASGVSNIHIQP
ncbi:hypothetical protein C8R43DRAFT_519612 [Mycena crocata]|nr:hypothetical protein C8R43DRAFT_519612 [Mycena crocata]